MELTWTWTWLKQPIYNDKKKHDMWCDEDFILFWEHKMCVHMFQANDLTSISWEYFADSHKADGTHAGMLITGDYFCVVESNTSRIYILLGIHKMLKRRNPRKGAHTADHWCLLRLKLFCVGFVIFQHWDSPVVESKEALRQTEKHAANSSDLGMLKWMVWKVQILSRLLDFSTHKWAESINISMKIFLLKKAGN